MLAVLDSEASTDLGARTRKPARRVVEAGWCVGCIRTGRLSGSRWSCANSSVSICHAKRVDSAVISLGWGLRTRDRNMDTRRLRTGCDSVRWEREAIWISTAGPEIPKALARFERRPRRPVHRPSPTRRKPWRKPAFGGETGVQHSNLQRGFRGPRTDTPFRSE